MAAASSTSSTPSIPSQLRTWSLVGLAVFLLAVLSWALIFGSKFVMIFSGIALVFVLPYIWEIYGKDAIVLSFYSALIKGGWRIFACVIIYLLLRNYASHFIHFGLMTTQTIAVSDGRAGLFELGSLQVLFDSSFALVMGYPIVRFIYRKKGEELWSRNIVGPLLVLCVIVQMFMFTTGDSNKIAKETMKPMMADKVGPAIQRDGILGGGARRVIAVLFGEPNSVSIASHRAAKASALQDYNVYGTGTYHFNLKAGEMTDKWIVLQPGQKLKYNISSKDEMFQMYFSENEVYSSWKNEMASNKSGVRFKLVAVTDQSDIIMTVK